MEQRSTISASPASRRTPAAHPAQDLAHLFLACFLASCLWFWWLVSLVYRGVLDLEDPVSNQTLGLSVLAAGCFAGGFLVRRPRPAGSGRRPFFSAATLDRCEALSWKLTLLLFPPAMALAVAFACASWGKPYNEGGRTGFADQVVYYLHLFFGFMFLSVVTPGKDGSRRAWLAAALLVLPRLVVSLHFGRAFLAQGVVPILFIAVGRGFVRLSWTRLLQLALLGLFILFVPSITRGDFSTPVPGAEQAVPQFVSMLVAGSSLQVTEDYLDLDLTRRCPPLLVSLTERMVPYALLHWCTLRIRGEEVYANLDRIVSAELFARAGLSEADESGGTGTSFLLELYLTGGAAAVAFGSLVFGLLCRGMTSTLATRSLFSGIWAECLMRAVQAPRQTLGNVFEKVPGLMLATFLVVLIGAEIGRTRGRARLPLSASPTA